MKDRHFRCGSLRILLLLCLIVSTQTTIQADIVKGRVVDAETKEPLPVSLVTLRAAVSVTLSEITKVAKASLRPSLRATLWAAIRTVSMAMPLPLPSVPISPAPLHAQCPF